MYSNRTSASTTPRRSAYTSRAYTSGLSSSFGGGLSSPTRSPTYSSSYTSSSWFPSSTYNSYSTSGYSSYNGKASADPTSPVHHRRTATSTLGTASSSYRSRSYTNDDTAITSPTRVTRTYRGARSQTDLPLSDQRSHDTSGFEHGWRAKIAADERVSSPPGWRSKSTSDAERVMSPTYRSKSSEYDRYRSSSRNDDYSRDSGARSVSASSYSREPSIGRGMEADRPPYREPSSRERSIAREMTSSMRSDRSFGDVPPPERGSVARTPTRELRTPSRDYEYYSLSSTENRSTAGARAAKSQNGDIDYKKLWEESQVENSRLRDELKTIREDLHGTKSKLEQALQSSKSGLTDSEKREKKALEKKLSEMEEELKLLALSENLTDQQLEHLKNDNQRLRDENGALIRVISKLSK